MSKFTDRLRRGLVREHGGELAQIRRPAAKPAKRLAGVGRHLIRPRIAAAFALVAVLGLNATGAFGLNVFGLHSALTTSSLPGGFQSASTATYGFLTETSTTCSQFSGSSASPLPGLLYTAGSTGTISLVNPPQFYYFVGVTATSVSASYTITETTSPSYNHSLPLVTNGSQVFDSTCTRVKTQKITYLNGITTVKFTAVVGQTYFLALKYSASSGLVGQPRPTSGTTTYTFATNGGETSMVPLGPKP
jgi:hypothetical protein